MGASWGNLFIWDGQREQEGEPKVHQKRATRSKYQFKEKLNIIFLKRQISTCEAAACAHSKRFPVKNTLRYLVMTDEVLSVGVLQTIKWPRKKRIVLEWQAAIVTYLLQLGLQLTIIFSINRLVKKVSLPISQRPWKTANHHVLEAVTRQWSSKLLQINFLVDKSTTHWSSSPAHTGK